MLSYVFTSIHPKPTTGIFDAPLVAVQSATAAHFDPSCLCA